jgi:hypothetical protein
MPSGPVLLIASVWLMAAVNVTEKRLMRCIADALTMSLACVLTPPERWVAVRGPWVPDYG